MSTFKAEVVAFTLSKHPNADSLSIAAVKGWECVVKTSDFESTNPVYSNLRLAVYVPVDAVAEEDHPLLSFMGGKRVKTVKLRGVYSQGILLPMEKVLETYLLKKFPEEGDDLTRVLGIKKWEEPIKPLSGSLKGDYDTVKLPDCLSKYTDIERFNNYPNEIIEGEEVHISEKLHGSSARFGLVNGEFFIASRNLGIRTQPKIVYIPRFKFKRLNKFLKSKNLDWVLGKKKVLPVPENWWTLANIQNHIESKLRNLADLLNTETITVYGEIVGQSVQDLGYGYTSGSYGFYAYDLKYKDEFLDPKTFQNLMSNVGFNVCPTLKVGPFSKEDLNLRLGKTTVNNAGHVREGVVIKPVVPRSTRSLGRVILKAISEEYDMRKGAKDN